MQEIPNETAEKSTTYFHLEGNYGNIKNEKTQKNQAEANQHKKTHKNDETGNISTISQCIKYGEGTKKQKGSKKRTSEKRGKDNLHIWFTNADTLTKEKVLELIEEVKGGAPPDIIAVSELKPKNYTRQLCGLDYKIDGYNFEQEHMVARDSTRGMALYLNKSLRYRRLNKELLVPGSYNPPKEMISVEIPLADKEKLLFTCVYRSPTSTLPEDESINEFIKTNGQLKQYPHQLIVGDFNRKEINWETLHSPSENDCRFIEAVRDSYLSQRVTDPTRGRGSDAPSLLDLAFCSNDQAVKSIDVCPPLGKSDHSLIKIVYQSHPDEFLGRTVKSYEKADFKTMKEKLSIDWESFFEKCEGDVNLMWKKFKSYYDKVEAEYIPRKIVKIGKRRFKYAFDKTILNKRKKKYRQWKRYMETRDAEVYKEYCRTRNQLRRATRKVAKQQEKEIAKKSKANSKAFWKFVNSRSKIQSSVADLVADVNHPNKKVTEDSDKAEVLGAYFSEVFVNEPDWVWVMNESEKPTIVEELNMNFSVDDVHEKLAKLDPHKSPGPDNLEPRALKELARELAQPLFMIYSASLCVGKLPIAWKTAIVTPVYKNKGSKHYPENYRPISLTSVACKILESIVRDATLKYLKANVILSEKQFGFLGGRSTTLQLLKIMDEWTKIIDGGGIIDVIFCDFKKAFDTVPHRRLLLVLHHYGIKEPLMSWIEDFLKDRKQQVSVDGCKSQVFDVLSGVPQGSVLGPLLFIMYINVMIDKSGDANLFLYADDLKLYREIKSGEDCVTLQRDVDRLYDWTRYSLLEFHPDKCEALRLGPKKKTENLPNCYYAINDTRLKIVGKVKDLGIKFDAVLSFEDHIHDKVNKANALAGMIRRNFEYLDEEMFKMLFVAIVRPHLEYGASIWNPDSKYLTNLIENVQRRATRMLPGMRDLSYKERLKRINLPTLEYRRYRGEMIEMFKLSHNMYDGAVSEGFLQFSQVEDRPYNLRRHAFTLAKVKFNTKVRQRSFQCRVVDGWNNLPTRVVEAPSLNAFKNRLDDLWKYNDLMFDNNCDLREVTSSRSTRYR